MRTLKRPALRWHGGKWRAAPKIIQFFPPHRRYVEPFGGSASVLLRKARSHVEIYNDLDDDVVTFFRVLQDPAAGDALEANLRATPFARREFELAYQPAKDPVEIARRLVIRAFMGFGSDGHNAQVKTGFRANSDRSHTTPAHDWTNYPDAMAALRERLRGVVIEHRPAIEVILAADMTEALHYVDPPYLPEVRSTKSRKQGDRHRAYSHEMTREDHVDLLRSLLEVRGMVVLSGYPCDLYDDMLAGWTRHEFEAMADGARPRTEALWLNPACEAALRLRRAGHDSPLFREAAE